MSFFNFFNQKNSKSYNKGYITLMSILFVGAVGLSVVTSVILLGIGSSRSSFALENSTQAKALADACAEEGLQRIRDDQHFNGSGSLSLGYGNCTYTVTDTGGESRTIASAGIVGTIVQKIEVKIDSINPQINIKS